MNDLNEFHSRRRAAATRRQGGAGQNDIKFNEPRPLWLRLLLRLCIVAVCLAVFGSLLGYLAFTTITSPYKKWAQEFNLEDINNLDHPCVIYDRSGLELGRIYDENRSYVSLDKVAPSMLDALVAQEDKTFWTHKGYDLLGIVRAGKAALSAGGEANQGASTITQQLARGAFDLEKRTTARGGDKYVRKIVEIFLAMRIEGKYDKRQIIEFYLNRIYFGRGYYGIRAASLGYYGKEPKDLTVRESASLAALIKNPENYNPIRNPKLNLRWRNDVITRMQRSNYLTADEASRIKDMPLDVNPKPLKRNTSHLYSIVQKRAMELFRGDKSEEIVKSAGIRVYTTIDKPMQVAAEAKLKSQLELIEARDGYKHVRFSQRKDPRFARHDYVDGLAYALDNKSGAVLVYVGGRSFDYDNFDLIESGRRPVGTAILPFLYAAAFDHGFNPCTRMVDDAMDNRLAGIGGSEGILGEWGMELEKGSYLDSVTLRQSLSWSKISSSARLGMVVGAKNFIKELRMFGITPPPRNANSTEANPVYYPRVYLGTEAASIKELLLAYTSFPNSGSRPIAPYIITKVTDSNGNVLWEDPIAVTPRLVNSIKPATSYRVHSIMKQGLESGAAARLRPYLPDDFNGVVKTGSNYDFADNCAVGYSSSVSAVVWVGFLNVKKAIYPLAFSSDTCAPVLGDIFKAAQGRFEDELIGVPDDTDEVEICRASGQLATEFCFEHVMEDGKPSYKRDTYLEYFPKGDMSLGLCSVHGDRAPSLGDFITADHNSSRILPVAPFLPQSLPLIGNDPYGCEMHLNPRHKGGAGLSAGAATLMTTPNFKPKEGPDQDGDAPYEGLLELKQPRPISLPSLPLQL